jgi:hypothetical protein
MWTLSKSASLGFALGMSGGFRVHFKPGNCIVPPEWRDKPAMRLDYALGQPVHVTDLEIDDTCLMGTFSFNRTPFHVRVLLSEVTAICAADGKPVWVSEDAPKPAPEPAKPRGKLTLVMGGKKHETAPGVPVRVGPEPA